ncbi:MAG: GntR family transcriptional regulator [Bacteroidota bacterium]
MEEFKEINEHSKVPKYLQLVDLIMMDIKSGKLSMGSRLPSINEISFEYYLSRDTVEKALKELRNRGIITSIKRRGYFISKTDFKYETRIAFITNTITDYKRNIYEAFSREIGENTLVDVYVYNYDIRKFEIILKSHMDEYDYFLVIPFFQSAPHYQKALELLNSIPDRKLLVLDNPLSGIKSDYSSVTQDFELDIREALISMNDQLSAYRIHYILYSSENVHPKEVIKGFEVFCRMFKYEYKVLSHLDPDMIHAGANYILLNDDQLVTTIELIRGKKLELGKDVGLISYNETPLKRILAGGISVISTDWQAMGQKAAELILNHETGFQRVPFKIYLRNSLLR